MDDTDPMASYDRLTPRLLGRPVAATGAFKPPRLAVFKDVRTVNIERGSHLDPACFGTVCHQPKVGAQSFGRTEVPVEVTFAPAGSPDSSDDVGKERR